jgi:hypothetical protein
MMDNIIPLKPKLVQIVIKNSVRTSKRTHHFITTIILLTLFKEIIAVYIETHKRPINTECTVTDEVSGPYSCHLPLKG